jgi:hypothetical protein
MATVRYRIPDEPRPTGLVKYAVDPMWPLLACMLGGNAIGLLWFAFNTRALGSVSALREYGHVLLSPLACVAVFLAIASGVDSHWLPSEASVAYAALAYPAVKLTIAYLLYLSQARSAELLVHYGGVLRNGAVGLFGAFLLAHNVIDKLPIPRLFDEALR